jgi:hypothetical protein
VSNPFDEYPDGTGIAHITCDRCGVSVRDVFRPGTKWAIVMNKVQDEPRSAILTMKEYYKERGWKISWGYDLCPECVEKTWNDVELDDVQ